MKYLTIKVPLWSVLAVIAIATFLSVSLVTAQANKKVNVAVAAPPAGGGKYMLVYIGKNNNNGDYVFAEYNTETGMIDYGGSEDLNKTNP